MKELRSAGIRIRKFARLWSARGFLPGRRLHQKVLVADEEEALVGGINIADKYRGTMEEHPWLDFALYVQGPACRQLDLICDRIFRKRKWPYDKKTQRGKISRSGDVRILVNDWLKRKFQVSRAYRKALMESKDGLIIVAGYFLPGYTYRRLLKKARARGVEISLLLPEESDVGLMRNAMRYFYGELLSLGIKIYEYRRSVVHGKLLVVDRRIVNTGSYNLNDLSDFVSMELNLEVDQRTLGEVVATKLEYIMQQECIRVTKEKFERRRSVGQRFRETVAYYAIRWAIRIASVFSSARGE